MCVYGPVHDSKYCIPQVQIVEGSVRGREDGDGPYFSLYTMVGF